MTGSLLFNRQHSSIVGGTNKSEMVRPKLRRCSSADDHNLNEITPDDQYKEKFFIKNEQIISDDDSGIEDFACEQINNVNEEEPSLCFGACEDEDLVENSTQITTEQLNSEENVVENIHHDLILAANVPDHEKKDFCSGTCEVFHAEFARLVSCYISLKYPGIRYYLFAEDNVNTDPTKWPGFFCIKLDNAKAQFKCPNIACGRLWTSMRARISFKISRPQPYGFVVLKILKQNCQNCETPADALWYIEEVCRVMKNLSKTILRHFFPSMINNNDLENVQVIQNVDKRSQSSRHDPHQRKGKMHAPHDRNHCEACQLNLCFG